MENAREILMILNQVAEASATYGKILHSVKSASRDLERLSRDLQTEHQILANTCELVLQYSCSDDVIEEMIDDPSSAAWSKHDSSLHLRLQQYPPVFQATLMDMALAARHLRKQLGITETGEVKPQHSSQAQLRKPSK